MLPIGPTLTKFPSGKPPIHGSITGRYVSLELVNPAQHGHRLYEQSHVDEAAKQLWTYMSYGPWEDEAGFTSWLESQAALTEPQFYTVLDAATGDPKGMVSFLNIRPGQGVIEAGHIWYVPEAQRTRIPAEAMYLMFRHAFDERGYRRLEWKCDSLNAPSRSAALRFGFRFEGIFRQHMIYKNRNRDTAWYAIMDHEWPAIRTNFERWLEPSNFDPSGRQKSSLGEANRALTASPLES
jgi:RimJ/RimL family protein N-acetyltransferase